MATGSSVNDTRASQLSSAGIRLMTIEASIPSHIDAITPLVERLMQLIGRSRSAAGNEFAVELALREALRNAVIHGNKLLAQKSVSIVCRCEYGKRVSLTISDQGSGFDLGGAYDPFPQYRGQQGRGRGIRLMREVMDELSFERGGSEVHMSKAPSFHYIKSASKMSLQNRNEKRNAIWLGA